ncbi:unnamed protein product [Ectocarpus sp. 6 AP-2014]
MATRAQPRTALATMVAFGAGVAYILWRRARSMGDEEMEEWEPVDRDHVVKFFQILNQQSHQSIMSFNQQIVQYRGKVPEQHLTDLAVGHFEDSLAKTQAQISVGMGISLEDMEDASKYYEEKGDQQVKEQLRHLKNLYLTVSNLPTDEEEPELPDDLTVEKMVTVVTAFFKASNNVIESVVQELLAKGGDVTNPETAMKMSMAIQEKSGPATDEAIKRFNLNSTTIGPAMDKFREHEEIKTAIMVGSEEQHQILRTYGLMT